MAQMDQSLAYLREILSNYTEGHSEGKKLFDLLKNEYQSVEQFAEDLDEGGVKFLNSILPEEIDYSLNEKDEERAGQLNKVYEQLI
ncbi:sigma-G-dependent sporulation-specific acid-soluble spore protein CsgA [Bacillus sp. FJAT-27245]|uniref:sigma-G-dependent sporulation-specific acid-soluble spore protein CsgA n=1 Tax=Bacillus sp. FJAT-27245 TaxID=1684144 RepID=UPI000A5D28B6|nr:sigma-G-dependent sporulation-specific acid-soluble spore protein CsgA [Bacillus sp. FJAT-27245]